MEKEHVSKLRYMDKLNVNNLDNRMLILDRRIDHDQSQEGGSFKRQGFTIKRAMGSSQEDVNRLDADSHLAQEINKYVYSSKT